MSAPTKVKPTSLLDALPLALAAVENARKDASNPHFKSKYSTLASVVAAIRPVADHGIWFRQVPLACERGVAYETFYIGYGEQISAGVSEVPVSKNDAQGVGSAKTYARRYGLMDAFGIAPEDDDGNAAAAAPPQEKPKREAWGTPITGKSALHKALTLLERELAGCGDSEMVYGLSATQEWQNFVTTAEKHAPHYLRGGEPAPTEFEGLLNTAERMISGFEQAEANDRAA